MTRDAAALADYHLQLEEPAARWDRPQVWLLGAEGAPRPSAVREAAAQRRETGRALLIQLLARASGRQAEEISLGVDVHGRPSWRQRGDSRLQFSLSRCASLVAVAMGAGGPVGVDVEEVPAHLEEHRLLAQQFCTASERRWLATRPEEGQAESLMRLMTAKEALVKALGIGAAVAMETIELEPVDDHGGRFISIGGNRALAQGWRCEQTVWHPIVGRPAVVSVVFAA